jgi:hypothetical protein
MQRRLARVVMVMLQSEKREAMHKKLERRKMRGTQWWSMR